MKVFIGCSSEVAIEEKYLFLAEETANLLCDDHYDLVFGAAVSSMSLKCYETFLKRGQKAYAYTVEAYQDDLPKLMEAECFVLASTMQRIEAIYQQSDLLVLLPGGIGTLTEIFSVLEEKRTFQHLKPIILYNYEHYYDSLLQVVREMMEKKFVKSEIFDMIQVVTSSEQFKTLIKERR